MTEPHPPIESLADDTEAAKISGPELDVDLREIFREIDARKVSINGVVHTLYPAGSNRPPTLSRERPTRFPEARDKLLDLITEIKASQNR